MSNIFRLISDHFDFLISLNIYLLIGLLVIVFASKARHLDPMKTLQEMLFFILLAGQIALCVGAVMTFRFNLKEKEPLDFTASILPTTEWVKEDLTIHFIDGNKLEAVTADGKSRKTLFTAPDPIREYTFSPDGRYMTVITEQELYLYNREKGVHSRVDSLGLPQGEGDSLKGVINAVQWDPTGSKFCYHVARWSSISSQDHWLVFDVKSQQKITVQSPAMHLRSLVWSKDSRSLYSVGFAALDPSVFAHPFEVKIYRVPLDDPRPELAMKFFSDQETLPPEHLALRNIFIYRPRQYLSFGRGNETKGSEVSRTGAVIGIDKEDHLYYIGDNRWRVRVVKWKEAFFKTKFGKEWQKLLQSHANWKRLANYVQNWFVTVFYDFSTDESRARKNEVAQQSVWRRRLYQIPRVPEDYSVPGRYQYRGGRLAVEDLRWLPSGRYVIMEHYFIGILILEPTTGRIGVLVNERGNSFGWLVDKP